LGGLVVAVSPYLAGVRKALKIIEKARAEKDEYSSSRNAPNGGTCLTQQQTEVRERLQDANQRGTKRATRSGNFNNNSMSCAPIARWPTSSSSGMKAATTSTTRKHRSRAQRL
jgi:hypothetical protein